MIRCPAERDNETQSRPITKPADYDANADNTAAARGIGATAP